LEWKVTLTNDSEPHLKLAEDFRLPADPIHMINPISSSQANDAREASKPEIAALGSRKTSTVEFMLSLYPRHAR
jgi:hypothetical protein